MIERLSRLFMSVVFLRYAVLAVVGNETLLIIGERISGDLVSVLADDVEYSMGLRLEVVECRVTIRLVDLAFDVLVVAGLQGDLVTERLLIAVSAPVDVSRTVGVLLIEPPTELPSTEDDSGEQDESDEERYQHYSSGVTSLLHVPSLFLGATSTTQQEPDDQTDKQDAASSNNGTVRIRVLVHSPGEEVVHNSSLLLLSATAEQQPEYDSRYYQTHSGTARVVIGCLVGQKDRQVIHLGSLSQLVRAAFSPVDLSFKWR